MTSFKPFFVRSYTLSKHHSRYLKDGKVVFIFDHLSYMTTILRQPGPLHKPFHFEYSLTNQYLGSNKGALIQSGTKFEYIIMQRLIFLDERQAGEMSEFGNIP